MSSKRPSPRLRYSVSPWPRKYLHRTVVFGGRAVGAIQVGLFAGVPVDIRADYQVEPAVAVDIDKGRRRTPAPLGNASLRRDVSEGAVALIAKQPRLPITR